MASANANIQVGRLRKQIQKPVGYLARSLLIDMGENLQSLCVVGSALTEDYHPKFSDINTIVVVRQRSHQLLQQLAGHGRKLGRMKLRAPLLMTQEYIQRSVDVFGVELLDFQFNHVVVYGTDPVGELNFQKEDVRLQCERQLKGALIKLRQGYIQALGKSKIVAAVLQDCVKELSVLLRALLWLADIERDKEGMGNLKKCAQEYKFDGKVISYLLELQLAHRRCPADQVEYLFEQVYQTIDHLSRQVDMIENMKTSETDK